MVATAFDPAEVSHIRRDAAALERFYLAHYDDVVRYLVRRLHDPHDVADLVADTFLAAMDTAGSYDHRRGGPLPWLIGIAHNKLRRWYRRQNADRDLARRAVGRRLLDADDIADLEARIDAEASGALRALDRLTPNQRELVDLVDLQGFTPVEAARVLGVSAGVARIRLYRARKALRNTLDPDPGRSTHGPGNDRS
jgi:RNA polymerase sigma factor (sigma-70 family)